MLKWLKNIKRTTLIKNSFLIPILSVVIMSISHVISWYDLGNPVSWAIYLSVAIEIFALASVSAASINIKKGSIWALFILVTLIQIVGNVYFTFQEIDVTAEGFKSWVELIAPWFTDWDITDHRRFLSYIQGGTLPFMSLIALHFYIIFNESLKNNGEAEKVKTDIEEDEEAEEVKTDIEEDEEADIEEDEEAEEVKTDIIDESEDEITKPIETKISSGNPPENDYIQQQWAGRRKERNPRNMPGVN